MSDHRITPPDHSSGSDAVSRGLAVVVLLHSKPLGLSLSRDRLLTVSKLDTSNVEASPCGWLIVDLIHLVEHLTDALRRQWLACSTEPQQGDR